MTKVCEGVVIKYGHERGYGFILHEGTEVFCHVESFQDRHKVGPPAVGDHVRFVIIKDRGKLRANRITRFRRKA